MWEPFYQLFAEGTNTSVVLARGSSYTEMVAVGQEALEWYAGNREPRLVFMYTWGRVVLAAGPGQVP